MEGGTGVILTLKLEEPFLFDGNRITEISMEGLMNVTAAELCAVDMQMAAKGYSGIRLETTRQYAMFLAAKINKRPWEFCNNMKARDTIRLRELVATFFYVKS